MTKQVRPYRAGWGYFCRWGRAGWLLLQTWVMKTPTPTSQIACLLLPYLQTIKFFGPTWFHSACDFMSSVQHRLLWICIRQQTKPVCCCAALVRITGKQLSSLIQTQDEHSHQHANFLSRVLKYRKRRVCLYTSHEISLRFQQGSVYVSGLVKVNSLRKLHYHLSHILFTVRWWTAAKTHRIHTYNK